MKSIVLLLAGALSILGAVNKNLADYDGNCDGKHPSYNCRKALQKFFADAKAAGGGTLTIAPGATRVAITEPLNNVDCCGGYNQTLQPSWLLFPPPNVTIQGVSPSSLPSSQEQYTANTFPSTLVFYTTSVPLFSLLKASGFTAKNLHLQYDGTAYSYYYPYKDTSLLPAAGYTNIGYHDPGGKPRTNLGSNNEFWTIFYCFDSDNLTWQNLYIDSAVHSAYNVMGSVWTIKGKGLLTAPPDAASTNGGPTQTSNNHVIDHVYLRDYAMGGLISSTNGMNISNVTGDYRGGTTRKSDGSGGIPPGHLFYFTHGQQFDAQTKHQIGDVPNTNLTVQHIHDGPHYYGITQDQGAYNTTKTNIYLGTFAPKSIRGGTFNDIQSECPVGLLQSLVSLKDVTFSNIKWTTSFDVCSATAMNARKWCDYVQGGAAIINSLPNVYDDGRPVEDAMENLKFINISLRDSSWPLWTKFMGDNITIQKMSLFGDPSTLPSQKSTQGVITIAGSNGVSIDATYTPLTSSSAQSGNYNLAVNAFNYTSKDANPPVVKYVSNVTGSLRVLSPQAASTAARTLRSAATAAAQDLGVDVATAPASAPAKNAVGKASFQPGGSGNTLKVIQQ